jgi:hypothetical protein
MEECKRASIEHQKAMAKLSSLTAPLVEPCKHCGWIQNNGMDFRTYHDCKEGRCTCHRNGVATCAYHRDEMMRLIPRLGVVSASMQKERQAAIDLLASVLALPKGATLVDAATMARDRIALTREELALHEHAHWVWHLNNAAVASGSDETWSAEWDGSTLRTRRGDGSSGSFKPHRKPEPGTCFVCRRQRQLTPFKGENVCASCVERNERLSGPGEM